MVTRVKLQRAGRAFLARLIEFCAGCQGAARMLRALADELEWQPGGPVG